MIGDAPEWLTAPVLAELVAADPQAVSWLARFGLSWLVVVVSAGAIGVYLIRSRRQPRHEHPAPTDASRGTGPDDSDIDLPLDEPADAVFDGEDVIRPADNPWRRSRWAGLDVRTPNSGAWLDGVSRERNQDNGRWITEERRAEQERRVVEVAERITKNAAETTQEIKRGDPGE